MKKVTICLLMIFAFSTIQSQNYEITFQGTGASTNIDSVLVQNTSRGTSITVQGSDVLLLKNSATDVKVLTGRSFRIFPNPLQDESTIEYSLYKAGRTSIHIVDFSGRTIALKDLNLEKGVHTFAIRNLNTGIYTVSICTPDFVFNDKLVSRNTSDATPFISYISGASQDESGEEIAGLKSSQGLVSMDYTNGEALRYTGYSNHLQSVVNDMPNSSKTINFVFKTIPTLSTRIVSSITQTSATSGGTISSDGGSTITTSGICWSTSSTPTIANSKTTNGTTAGTFTSSLSGLAAGITYYVRAYATNSVGTAYGDEVSFKTSQVSTLPAITTQAISSITQTSATSGGTITSNGGSAITTSGICWSTSSTPTIANSKTTNGTTVGTFTSSLSGLAAGTTYYVRAYATNSVGTAYGDEVSFKTSQAAALPAITTQAISSITQTSATSGGTITSNGGSTITTSGICWSTSSTPTIANSKTTNGTTAGTFTSSLSGLAAGTIYYVRAYATNSVGTAYGDEVSFKTSQVAALPVITTDSVISITSGSFIGCGTIVSTGGSAITQSGLCVNFSPNQTACSMATTDGPTSGSFTREITQLYSNYTYYIRAYATNSAGTAYGKEITIVTLNAVLAPKLTTTAITSILQTTAVSGATITSDGGSPITASGICWSKYSYPSISSYKTTDGTATGTFTSSLSGLTAGTTYYVRAYATNSIGTSYGQQETFTTLKVFTLPVISTTNISSITQTGATSGGYINSDGNTPITTSGICWSTSPNPTITDNKTTDGYSSGSYTSYLTGLTANTTYYVRSYATNSVGTAYGDELTFTSKKIQTLASITTTAITSVTPNSALSGGVIVNDGGGITTNGVCWSLTSNPTIADSKTSNTVGNSSFTSSISGLKEKTTYYVRAYATNDAGTVYGDEVSFTTTEASLPTITTTKAKTITSSSFVSGGTIDANGGATITSSGICWSTTATPTINDPVITGSATSGTFTINVTGITGGLTYYVRAYATNSNGTGYGNVDTVVLPQEVTDVDGNVYQTMVIGSQVWMMKDLNTTKYKNGDLIGTTSSATLDISAETEPKYQWKNDDNTTNPDDYGRLYTHYAALDQRGVCPSGWHVPTMADWNVLFSNTGGTNNAGGRLKEKGTIHWDSPNYISVNVIPFAALPNGLRYDTGMFAWLGSDAYYWSSTGGVTNYAYSILFQNDGMNINQYTLSENTGATIRCLKD